MSLDLLSRQRRSSGFTLLEVMVAIATTAAIAAVAYSVVSAVSRAAEGQLEEAERLADLQLAMSIVERDLKQAIARPVVDELDNQLPALLSNSRFGALVEFSRVGWQNPLQLPRGGVQRVRYTLEDEQLWRENWQVLDRVSESRLQRALLFDGVEEVQLRFLDVDDSVRVRRLDDQWESRWPDIDPGGEVNLYALPGAIELTITLKDWGEVRRVFLLPG